MHEEKPDAQAMPSDRAAFMMGVLFAAAQFAVVLVVCAAFAFNNISLTSSGAHAERLDASIERARAWVLANEDRFMGPGVPRNAALFYMLDDIAQETSDAELAGLVRRYRNSPSRPHFWRRLLDSSYPVSEAEMVAAADRQRELGRADGVWFIHALDPGIVPLSPREQANLHDPGRWRGYMLTHQLWSLRHARRINPDTFDLDPNAIDTICRRIAQANARDLRTVDIFFERAAFLYMANRPDLVPRRWAERIMDAQHDNGGWGDRWLWFSQTKFGREDPASNPHAATLALWALVQERSEIN